MHFRLSSTQYHNGNESVLAEPSSKDTMELIKMSTVQLQQTHSKRTKRLFLWSILLIQFGFILCFWLMQLGLSGRLNKDTTGAAVSAGGMGASNRINFIKSDISKTNRGNEEGSNRSGAHKKETRNFQWPSRDLKFQQDFVLQQNTYNLTDAEKQMFGEPSLWCFKEGTINDTRLQRDDDSSQWPDYCQCLPEWHGQDCGQPEVIWRALLTAKKVFKLQNPTEDEAHRLVYMIEGPLLNMDLVELQIQAVIKVVDYFIIYYKRNLVNLKDIKTLKYRLKQLLPERNYMLYHCKLPTLSNCSTAEVYRIFRQQQLLTNAIKPTDLFIYTDDKTILGHSALNFLKYYSSNIPVIEFRLKFIIYGFYWQHPNLTKLKGLVCSFQHVDNSNSDPTHINPSHLSSSSQHQALVIGDLNHFGGWFCKYCQQPEEIINELELLQNAPNNATATIKSIQNVIAFPMDKKHSLHIDGAYVQQLISAGIYLNDGKTQLLKVRRFTDKYYAPKYATQQSWKYGNLLVNIYESLEDVLDDDNGDEMF